VGVPSTTSEAADAIAPVKKTLTLGKAPNRGEGVGQTDTGHGRHRNLGGGKLQTKLSSEGPKERRKKTKKAVGDVCVSGQVCRICKKKKTKRVGYQAGRVSRRCP